MFLSVEGQPITWRAARHTLAHTVAPYGQFRDAPGPNLCLWTAGGKQSIRRKLTQHEDKVNTPQSWWIEPGTLAVWGRGSALPPMLIMCLILIHPPPPRQLCLVSAFSNTSPLLWMFLSVIWYFKACFTVIHKRICFSGICFWPHTNSRNVKSDGDSYS